VLSNRLEELEARARGYRLEARELEARARG
jgi:hypothetical protein